jgi:hypothetical protein
LYAVVANSVVIFFKLLDELEITLPDGCFQTLGLD